MDLLRFCTAGNVDDGKSTLIGRLLHDTKSIMDDQYASLELASQRRKSASLDLALVTDGLRAERGSGITIDVAYRYFSTPKRKFILADTPGHPEHVRNMVTGASTANLMLLLVDVRHGLTEQTRRHAARLADRGQTLVLCVNKMDLVDYQESAFAAVRDAFLAFAKNLGFAEITLVPVSALRGDNVVDFFDTHAVVRWAESLAHLETVPVQHDRNLADARLPVQLVVEDGTYRAYAGAVSSGVFRVGDELVVLPSGKTTRLLAIDTFDGSRQEACAPQSVMLRTADDLGIQRGDVICAANNPARCEPTLEVMLCWMDESPEPARQVLLLHGTSERRATIESVHYRLNVNTLERETDTRPLAHNDLCRARLKLDAPLAFDDYGKNRALGGLLLVDLETHRTLGAGVIEAAPR